MLTNSDFEKLWFLYRMEGAPKNITLEGFSKSYGVNPEVFIKRLRKREQRIEPELIKGAMNSYAFHSINETLKLQGKSIKIYYHELLTAVASGRNDYEISINESRVKLA